MSHSLQEFVKNQANHLLPDKRVPDVISMMRHPIPVIPYPITVLNAINLSKVY